MRQLIFIAKEDGEELVKIERTPAIENPIEITLLMEKSEFENLRKMSQHFKCSEYDSFTLLLTDEGAEDILREKLCF